MAKKKETEGHIIINGVDHNPITNPLAYYN